jgi:nucleoside-diphosphate-sugar epimerase
MKTILITGINGFLGSHLAKKLSSNYNVIGLEYSLNNLYRLEGYSFPVFLSDESSIKNVFDNYKIDVVIHAATIYRRAGESFVDLINTNVVLPVKLYEIAQKNKTGLFINTDTFFNIEGTKYQYLGDYTLSKRHILEWLKVMQSETKIINMKLFHMYGPNDAPNKFIPSMISQLLKNKESIDLTPGEQKRDFIYIDDVTSAYKCVIENIDLIKDNISEYQVATGELTSIKDFVMILKKITNSNSVLNFGAMLYREGEIMVSEADNSALIKLRWKPKVVLEEGILNIINYKNS